MKIEDRIMVDIEHEKKVNMLEWSADVVIQLPRELNLSIDQGVGTLRIEDIGWTESISIDLGVGAS